MESMEDQGKYPDKKNVKMRKKSLTMLTKKFTFSVKEKDSKSMKKSSSEISDDFSLEDSYSQSEVAPMERQPLEGLLCKYTNVVNGWQYRWFALEPEAGRLEYYQREEQKRTGRPRGAVYLAGAVISPSDEDSQTFTVNAANGEIYRLRAQDARERQHWVNRLRATAEYHTDNIAQGNYQQQATSQSSQNWPSTYQGYQQQWPQYGGEEVPAYSGMVAPSGVNASAQGFQGGITATNFGVGQGMESKAPMTTDPDHEPYGVKFKDRAEHAIEVAGLMSEYNPNNFAYPLCDMIKSKVNKIWRSMVGLKTGEDWDPQSMLPPPRPYSHHKRVPKMVLNVADYKYSLNEYLSFDALRIGASFDTAKILKKKDKPITLQMSRLDLWERAMLNNLGIANMMAIFTTAAKKDHVALMECLRSCPLDSLPPQVVGLFNDQARIEGDIKSRWKALEHMTEQTTWALADIISAKRYHFLQDAHLTTDTKSILMCQPFGGPTLFSGRDRMCSEVLSNAQIAQVNTQVPRSVPSNDPISPEGYPVVLSNNQTGTKRKRNSEKMAFQKEPKKNIDRSNLRVLGNSEQKNVESSGNLPRTNAHGTNVGVRDQQGIDKPIRSPWEIAQQHLQLLKEGDPKASTTTKRRERRKLQNARRAAARAGQPVPVKRMNLSEVATHQNKDNSSRSSMSAQDPGGGASKTSSDSGIVYYPGIRKVRAAQKAAAKAGLPVPSGIHAAERADPNVEDSNRSSIPGQDRGGGNRHTLSSSGASYGATSCDDRDSYRRNERRSKERRSDERRSNERRSNDRRSNERQSDREAETRARDSRYAVSGRSDSSSADRYSGRNPSPKHRRSSERDDRREYERDTSERGRPRDRPRATSTISRAPPDQDYNTDQDRHQYPQRERSRSPYGRDGFQQDVPRPSHDVRWVKP